MWVEGSIHGYRKLRGNQEAAVAASSLPVSTLHRAGMRPLGAACHVVTAPEAVKPQL